MEIIPLGFIALVVWLVALTRGVPSAIIVITALLPFGMLSVANLPAVGGLSLKASSVCGGLLVVWLILEHLRSKDAILDQKSLSGAYLALILLTIYVVISSMINVRLFEGQIDVFSLSRGVERSGKGAVGRLTSLRPSSSNISQPAYMLLSIGFFFSVVVVIKRYGYEWIHRALLAAALVHLCLAILDAMALDGLLAYVRTANYALLTHHQVHGFDRIIGGFAEPSAFGTFSAALLAYFSLHALNSRSIVSALVAACLGCCVAVSFSSTAYFGSFFVALSIVLLTLRNTFLDGGIPRVYVYLAWLFAVGALVFLAINAEQVESILNSLIFNKAESASGQERGLWAHYGFRTFLETYGLGAGVGSIRSNGWAAVYLGSVGMPGALLACYFWVQILFKPLGGELDEAKAHIYFGAKAAVFVSLMMKLASATTPDPGLALMLYAGCVCGLRELLLSEAEDFHGEVEA